MRILVVEDARPLGATLRRALQEEGYAVDLATDGVDGLWRAQEFDYDAIVLDLMLPGLDGLQVCRQLRAAGRWAPVLILTAKTQVDDRVRGLDAGADDYLPKPFSLLELSARLRALTRRGQQPRHPVITVGDLRLDPAARRAWRAHDELTLSSREFTLLETLMRHSGIVLTRSSLLDQVWDCDTEAISNVVDQYIGYLRRKVDRPYGRDDIETVRGNGYRLRSVPSPPARP